MTDFDKVHGTATKHQGSPALTSRDLPLTSHQAATSVNTTKMERVVIDALFLNKSLTSEEISEITGFVLTSITPRMAALHERNIIYRPTNINGFITRIGKSGCNRLTYSVEKDMSKWLGKRPYKINRAEKISTLEAEIIRLNKIIKQKEYEELLNEIAGDP